MSSFVVAYAGYLTFNHHIFQPLSLPSEAKTSLLTRRREDMGAVQMFDIFRDLHSAEGSPPTETTSNDS